MSAASPPVIAAVSDVSVGYGSPQVLSFLKSLGEMYGSPVVLFEPDQPERPRPPEMSSGDGPSIERIPLVFHPHRDVRAGRVEYILQVTRRLNRLRPDVLVIFCTYALPVLLNLRYRPTRVIYYSIESIAAYGNFDIRLNRALAGRINLVIFPEEHRAMLDMARCRFHGVPVAVVYNCADGVPDGAAPVPPAERLRRVLYAGTIDRVRTHAEYLLHKRLQDAPFDLAGPVGGWDDPSTFFSGLPPSMRYLGILDAKDLAVLRTRYAYTLVLWNPDSENTRYAAPNKFFESIAAGVPAIAAPHPQCATLIGRYGCGVLMQGWDLDAFADAVRKSLAMFGTPAYAAMVEGCRRAQQRELSWARQFDKLRPHLEPHAQEFRNGNGHR